jgi:predicted ATP-grasp superfamily ATP-dependent carboligase
MSWIEGRIISGEYDHEMNVFTIQKLKQFFVQSVLHPHQMQHLSNYLKNYQNEDKEQIVILYDQMPVRLSQEEIKQFVADLDEIQSRCKGFS